MQKPQINYIQSSSGLSVMQLIASGDTSFTDQKFTDHTLLCVLEGSTIISINGSEHLLQAKENILIPPGNTISLLILTRLNALIINRNQ